jgi:hypothetical protein
MFKYRWAVPLDRMADVEPIEALTRKPIQPAAAILQRILTKVFAVDFQGSEGDQDGPGRTLPAQPAVEVGTCHSSGERYP